MLLYHFKIILIVVFFNLLIYVEILCILCYAFTNIILRRNPKASLDCQGGIGYKEWVRTPTLCLVLGCLHPKPFPFFFFWDPSLKWTIFPIVTVVSCIFFFTVADSTGTHSLYTTYKDYEIMFHVSTMLPYTPNNKQQVRDPCVICGVFCPCFISPRSLNGKFIKS